MNYTVLSTKVLDKNQQQLLLNAGIGFVEYDAIKIEPLNFQQRGIVENAIITSQNTVKRLVENKVDINNCFCVGTKTKQLLEEHQYKVIETADYGSLLAQKIIAKHKQKTFTFFCGLKRRDELPGLLRENNVQFDEVHVYDTILNQKKIERTFDGVLFFSPSGVLSFIQENNLQNTTAFCIGSTTAEEAKKHTNNVIIASRPTIENVIVQVVKKLG